MANKYQYNIIELKNITKKYISNNNEQLILDDVSYSFKEGSKISVLGYSGSGKTTLLNLIGGIDPDFEGEMLFRGEFIKDFDKYRRENVSFIFQDLNLISHHSLLKNIIIGMTNDVLNKEEKASDILKRVGLLEQSYKKPHQLSGGERQRVAIARALARDTDLLLCDEPTGNLDEETKIEIMDLIVDVFKEKTIIFITHDKNLAEKYSDIILEINNKKLNTLWSSDTDCYEKKGGVCKKEKKDCGFDKRFEINLLSRKLSLINAAYLIIVISGIFLFGTGIVQGIEKRIDNYLYEKYKVDKIDISSSSYTIDGFGSLIDDLNKSVQSDILGYMTGLWIRTDFLEGGEERYNFLNSLQIRIKDKIVPDIVYGRFPENNDEILYSKGAAIKKIFEYHTLNKKDEEEQNKVFEWLIKLSDEELFNELNKIDISYKNAREFNKEEFYDKKLKIAGLIDDLKYSSKMLEFGGNHISTRKHNVNSNYELSIEYKGENKHITVNDNIYMPEDEFINFLNVVYIGYKNLKLKAFSIFVEEVDLDIRNKVYDSLLLYKHMIYGKDYIIIERETYYDEVHGYKISIIGACMFLYIFSITSIYNGIKNNIDRNKINIGIYNSLGYTSKNIRYMFFKEGAVMLSIIIVFMLILWFVFTILLGNFLISAIGLSEVVGADSVVNMNFYSLFGIISVMAFIIFGSINKELKKIDIINLIKNK